MRFSAYSRSIRLPVNDSMIGNMRPLLRLPLCASASTSPPVFSSYVGHPLPQVARIVAAERRQRGERLDQARLRAVVAEDDVAMKIVAAGVRGPLVADERGEAARLVGLVRRLDRLAPGAAIGRRARRSGSPFGIWPLPKLVMMSTAACAPLPDLIIVVPFAALRRRQQLRDRRRADCGKKPMPSE